MDEVERELLRPYESSIVFHKDRVLGNISLDTFIRSNYVEVSFLGLYKKSLLEEKFDSTEPVSSLIVKINKFLFIYQEAESLNDKFKSVSLWKWMHRLLGSSLVNLREVVFIGITYLNCRAQKILMNMILMESSLEKLAVSAENFQSNKDLCTFGLFLSKFEGESVEVSFHHFDVEFTVLSSALHYSKHIPEVLMIELGNIHADGWKLRRYLEEFERVNVKILGSLALCQGSSLSLNSEVILDEFEKIFEIFDTPRLYPATDY